MNIVGNISVQNDIMESKSVHIAINPRKLKINVSGSIHAPKVTISSVGFFSKWLILPDIILKILGKKTRMKRSFPIKNLNINTQELIIRTRYPPERVNVEYINSNINVSNQEIEQSK